MTAFRHTHRGPIAQPFVWHVEDHDPVVRAGSETREALSRSVLPRHPRPNTGRGESNHTIGSGPYACCGNVTGAADDTARAIISSLTLPDPTLDPLFSGREVNRLPL